MTARLRALLEARGEEMVVLNSAVSRELGEIGRFQLVKFGRVLGLWLRLLWLRFRHGPGTLYYIPATGVRTQVWRDWLLLGGCRPFFQEVWLHWHGLGLREWSVSGAKEWERPLIRWTYGNISRSLILHEGHREEVSWLRPKTIDVLPNGVQDRCGPLWPTISRERQKRRLERLQSPDATVRLLFLGHLVAEVLEAAAQLAADRVDGTVQVDLAGAFPTDNDRQLFETKSRELENREARLRICHHGYVDPAQKDLLYREADLFLFPSYYRTEAMPLVVLEAMSWGVPVIVSRWRSMPSLLPEPMRAYAVAPQDPAALAKASDELLDWDNFDLIRTWFCGHFTEEAMMEQWEALKGRKVSKV